MPAVHSCPVRAGPRSDQFRLGRPGRGLQERIGRLRVGATGRVLATDISENLLAHLDQDAGAAGLTNIATRVMDGEQVDTEAGHFDAVISRVGLIYLPDRHGALLAMRRALRAGGRVGAIVYSTPDANTFFSIPVSVIRACAQLPPPLPGQPGPFSLGAPGVLADALTTAAFVDVDVRTVAAPLVFPTAADCVRFERESFGALHQMLAGLDDGEREDAWAEIVARLQAFEGPTGSSGRARCWWRWAPTPVGHDGHGHRRSGAGRACVPRP